MSTRKRDCRCGRPRRGIVFSCSGAADVGALADQAARSLAREKTASMGCMAAVAARVPEVLDSVRNAPSILAVDGCSKGCVKTVLSGAGIKEFRHLSLESLGFVKGESPPTRERRETVLRSLRARPTE